MRLLIKQRVFSWSDTYDVYDEWESRKYFVKADLMTLGHQIHVYDAYDTEIGSIHQKLLTFLPAFDIVINGNVAGRIRKKFSFLHPQYEVDCNNWHVQGDFMAWNYEVSSGSSSVMHISKELFHWGDTYVIDIQNPEDEIMGLLLVIAIDAANCNG